MNDIRDNLNLRGAYHVEHWRAGKLIGVYDIHNTITISGKNLCLNAMFLSATPIASWYMGLINNTPTPTTPNTDVYATRSWTEFTSFAEGVRQAWVPGTSTTATSTNATPATFTISGSAATVFGLFICGGGSSPTVPGDTAGGGTLWAAAGFTAPVAVNPADQLKVTYTING